MNRVARIAVRRLTDAERLIVKIGKKLRIGGGGCMLLRNETSKRIIIANSSSSIAITIAELSGLLGGRRCHPRIKRQVEAAEMRRAQIR